MNSIEKLIQIFSQFPGIGPRQARRFVYYLLTRANGTLEELATHIKSLKEEVTTCADCQRFFQSSHHQTFCSICADTNRDASVIMLVQRDADLESVEKNGGFKGTYFVLGGSVPILEKEPEKKIRINILREFVERKIKNGLKEIIIAVNWNPEGENTGDFVEKFLKPLVGKVKISHLGKGLSMGTELEYADSDTLKNALKNRD